jgi:hypothetical protein
MVAKATTVVAVILALGLAAADAGGRGRRASAGDRDLPLGRDHPCPRPVTRTQLTCSGVAQSDYEFAHTFAP